MQPLFFAVVGIYPASRGHVRHLQESFLGVLPQLDRGIVQTQQGKLRLATSRYLCQHPTPHQTPRGREIPTCMEYLYSLHL